MAFKNLHGDHYRLDEYEQQMMHLAIEDAEEAMERIKHRRAVAHYERGEIEAIKMLKVCLFVIHLIFPFLLSKIEH